MNLCTTCKFHVFGAMVPIPAPHPEEPPVMTAMGWCYRYPPQVTGQGMSSSPPVKSETTWCGEWKAVREPAMVRKGDKVIGVDGRERKL